MATNIQIAEPFDAPGLEALLRAAAGATLQQQALEEQVELSLVLTGDEELQQLNQLHRNLDEATDVLSFPSEDADPDSRLRYLGDVVISVPRAQAQAAAAGHALEAELQLLTTHGILHLLGHDHAEDVEKALMWAAQSEILEALGVTITMPADVDDAK